jgi:AraC-like DNA-binding protein
MSWAGKKSFRKFFRSLFRKEQAPSAPVSEQKVVPMLTAEFKELEDKLEVWVKEKGYRLPDSTIKQSAARIGTSSLKLHQYFSAQGTDFRAWRTALRIQDAMEMMKQEPETSVSAIGIRVGIPDRSNFCRQFKAIVGTTPEIWRKNSK